MNISFLHFPDDMTPRARRALQIGLTIAGLVILMIPFYIFLTLQSGAWQMWVVTGILAAILVAALIGCRLILRGQVGRGVQVSIFTLILGLAATPYLIADMGVFLGIICVVLTIAVAAQLLDRPVPLIVTGFAGGMVAAAADMFLLPYRLSLPILQSVLLPVSVVTLAVFGYFSLRSFRMYSLRTKLVIVFSSAVIASVGIAAFLTNRSLSASLSEQIGSSLAVLTRTKSIEIGQVVNRELDIVKVLTFNKAIQTAAQSATRSNPLSQVEIEQLDQEWRSADAANNNDDPLVRSVLRNDLSSELRDFQQDFPQHVEIFLTDLQGVSIAATNRTSDYYQADEEWWQTAYHEGAYIGLPEYDESSKTIAMTMATQVRAAETEIVVGVLRTTVNFEVLTNALVTGLFGQTGHTEVYLPNGQRLGLSIGEDGAPRLALGEGTQLAELLSGSQEAYLEVVYNGVPSLASLSPVRSPGDVEEGEAIIADLDWNVVITQDKAEALQSVETQTRNILFLAFAISIASVFVAIGLAQVISGPILRLNAVAERVSTGDLSVQAQIEADDETGALATTFNTMTARLRDLIGTLEERVAERTRSLELAADVGRSVSQVRTLDVMFKDAAELIRSQFDLYYVQVYLASHAQNVLLLRSGTGAAGEELVGRGHRLPLDTGSINGRAAVERRSVVIEDTSTSPTFLPNPLLPETRSEIAVPLMAADNVVGVLDLQSRVPGSLNLDLLPGFEALAGQLAIAIQNASLLAETEQARAEVEAQARRLTRAGWDEYLDAIQKPERVSYLFDGSKVASLDDTEPADHSKQGSAISVPIAIAGESLGDLVVEMGEQSVTPQNKELINTVARQVSQQIENLRLLDTAERYRAEAEQTTRRLTREGWDTYIQNTGQSLSYHYDSNEVRPLDDSVLMEESAALPLKVRQEVIGKLAVRDLDPDDKESVNLANAVAERLGTHIENLRLFEEAERRRLALQQGEARLRTLVENAPEAIVVVDLTTGLFTEPNENAVKLYGLSREELVKVGPAQMSPPVQPDGRDSNEKAAEKIGEAMQGKAPVFEWMHRNPQGQDIPCEVRLVRLPGDKPLVRASVTDITERKRYQEMLAQRANQLETVATLSSTASTVLDPDRLLQAVVDMTKERFGLYHAHIYLANDSWKTLILASGAGDVGRTLVAQGHAIQMNAEKSLVARAAREQQSVTVNDVRSQPDFLPNPSLPETRAEMAVPMIVGDTVLGVFDVQSEKVNGFSKEDAAIYTTLASQVAVALQNARLYVEQAATVTQLRELDRLKSSFLANMSHELRTPLNSILGFTDVILEGLDGSLTEFMDNDLRLIQKNGQHLLHLINDVLDMAKIESGRMNLNPETFKVHPILDEIVSITSTLASERSLSLYIDEDSDKAIEIFADSTRLRQVMLNLVNNSIKFTENGSVVLCARPMEGARILITVKDTGVGIPSDKLEAIFQEFTQVDPSATRKVGGTGLGLPISRRLVEMHGGRLWAESSGIDGEGATFHVELPVEARITDIVEKQEK